MKRIFLLSCCLMLLLQLNVIEVNAQNVGIGTTTPVAKLHVENGSVVFSEEGVVPVVPANPAIEGAGRRMLWYPDKAAFRVGYVDDNNWDKNFIGNYSIGAGKGVKASGESSVCMGWECNATGEAAIAMGKISTATGTYSVCLGYLNIASNLGSVSLGYHSYATGVYSVVLGADLNASGNSAVALGELNTASGSNAVALGFHATASGTSAMAIGNDLTASGNYSIAMGSYVSTSGFSGSLTIGDRSTTTVMSTFVDNGFRSRFAGGYRLFTNSAATVGAFLNANANSWAALSDVRLKENFLPVDGEAVLYKIAAMPQYTWNYIGQDVKTLRHYGPMAQDFYGAFGKDALGEIGCDTLINQQDFLGINLIAIQALEKRTNLLKEEAGNTKKLLEQSMKRIVVLEEQNRLLLELLKNKR